MYLFNRLISLAGTLIPLHVVVGVFADTVSVMITHVYLYF